MPFPGTRSAPWKDGHRPVKSDPCDGTVHVPGEMACVYVIPSLASAIRFGDVGRSYP